VELSRFGISVDLPRGFEGAIRRRPDQDVPAVGTAGAPVPVGGRHRPVVHLATFGLPTSRGDFGQDAVELMGPDDVFITLFEYERESAGAALFSSSGLPRQLRGRDFRPSQLQRSLPGQVGFQAFFTEAGRPFTLYVVLGGAASTRSVGRVNALLSQLRIDPDGD
jgi:hypothetical protein